MANEQNLRPGEHIKEIEKEGEQWRKNTQAGDPERR